MTIQPGDERDRRIVVGVDGSAASRAALGWAVRQAKLSGARVEAVTAWEVPLALRTPWPPGLSTDFRKAAADTLADAVADTPDADGRVEIRSEVVEGNPAQVLLDASAGAELLVVGSRGHGGFVDALLGSVGQHCVHHATCPVVVIRDSVTSGH
jgi:nucleotide-binding universal stress UspA family protein